MSEHPEFRMSLDGNVVAELLDVDEYHTKIGNVAAVSDKELCYLRRAHHELVPFRFEYFDMADCRAIEYATETAWYRVISAVVMFGLAVALAAWFIASPYSLTPETSPVLIVFIGLVTIGVRLVTSTHRHIIRFHMPEEILHWRSLAIDFKSKAKDANAVIEFARMRGIYREPAG